MSERPVVPITDKHSDWTKRSWDLPTDATEFLYFMGQMAGSMDKGAIGKQWYRFQQLPVFRAMPVELQEEVNRLLASPSYQP